MAKRNDIKKKILVVGSWVTTTYEEPLASALRAEAEVQAFKWGEFFGFSPLSNNFDVEESLVASLWNRFQNKYIVGPTLSRLNFALLQQASELKPDLIFLYRATHIWPKTVKELQKIGKVMVYNNDDPFSALLPSYIYRHYLGSLKYADWIFSYREKNIKDYASLGFSNTSLLRSNYLKSSHYRIEQIPRDLDLVFIGHFEDDGRDVALLRIMQELMLKVGLWGTNWENSKLYPELCKELGGKILPAFGETYNKTMNRAKIALVFFSKINSDGYTRRCFEIPATRTMMLCEYSSEMEKLFTEGLEADYFRNQEELLTKVQKYLDNHALRENIADNGYQRLLRDGHDINDRAKEILNQYYKLLE